MHDFYHYPEEERPVIASPPLLADKAIYIYGKAPIAPAARSYSCRKIKKRLRGFGKNQKALKPVFFLKKPARPDKTKEKHEERPLFLLRLQSASRAYPRVKTAQKHAYVLKPVLHEYERSTCARCLIGSRAVGYNLLPLRKVGDIVHEPGGVYPYGPLYLHLACVVGSGTS